MTTAEEVQKIIRVQADDLTRTNDHGITLKQAFVSPQRITVIVRIVKNGRIKQQTENVWLVGQENAVDGYRIVMHERDCQFGLVSPGFPSDKHLVLTGWYGSLKSAFLGM